MTDIALPPWSQRLGGRWLVSWQLYALGTPLSFLLYSWSGWAAAPPGTPLRELLAWVGLVAAACVAVGAWMWLASVTFLRHRATRPVALPWAWMFLASVGAIFASILIVGAPLVGAPAVPDPVWSLITTTVVSAWWGTTVDLVLDSRDRVLALRSELIEAAVQQELAAIHERDVLGRLRDAIEAQVDIELAPARQRLEAAVGDAAVSARAGQWARVAEQLRSTAQTSVRSLSSTLWSATEEAYPRPRLVPTLLGIMRTQPLRPWPVAALYVITASAEQVSRLGAAGGIGLTSLGAALIVILLTLANAAIRRRPRHHRRIFVAALVTLQVGGLAGLAIESSRADAPYPWFSALMYVVTTAVVVLGTSAFGAVQRANVDVLAAFALEVDAERVSAMARGRELARIAREASRILHGQVQTRLVACAAAIDRASALGDDQRLALALDEARRVLDAPLVDGVVPSTIGAALARQRDRWAGICVVTLRIDQALVDINGRCAAEVNLVVEEAIGNAFRHGQAEVIDVAVGCEGAAVSVTVEDDGDGVVGFVAPGTGLALIEQVAVDAVELAGRPEGGARIKVRVRAP